MKKRLLSMLLAALMCVSILPASIYASSETESTAASATAQGPSSADVNINLRGASVGKFAEGETYESCYIAAKQNDATSPDIDGIFAVRVYNSTIDASATISGGGAATAHIYTDSKFAHSHDGFELESAYNSNGNVVAETLKVLLHKRMCVPLTVADLGMLPDVSLRFKNCVFVVFYYEKK